MSFTESDQEVHDISKITMKDDCSVSSYALFSFITKRNCDADYGTNDATPESEPSMFELLSSTLEPVQVDQLQLFLASRLKKGAVYLRNGNFFEMDFTTSKKNPTSFDTCFYIFLPIQDNKQLVVCLLAATETNLETFRIELTSFCKDMIANVSVDEEPACYSNVLTQLSLWYDTCVHCASRVINAVGVDISRLLQLAQENGRVSASENVDISLVNDVKRFVSACLVADCLDTECPSGAEAILSMADNPGKLRVSGIISNPFCTEWGKLLLEHGQDAEAWKLRRVLESFKLKTIKDMNVLSRLLKQSEMDHYSIYRTYLFLCNSGNGDILLRQAKKEQGSAKDVITLLEQHLCQQRLGFHKPRTEER